MTFENELAQKIYDEIFNTHKIKIRAFDEMHFTQEVMWDTLSFIYPQNYKVTKFCYYKGEIV